MATALDMVTRALRIAGVLAAEHTASAPRAQAALDALNGMMFGLETRGIRLDHAVLALADTVNLPDAHIEPLTWMLAAQLGLEFGIPRQDVTAEAARHERALKATYAHVPEALLDSAYARSSARGVW